GNLAVRLRADPEEAVEHRLDPRARVVAHVRAQRKSRELEPGAIMGLEELRGQDGHRVAVQVGGEVAQPDAVVRGMASQRGQRMTRRAEFLRRDLARPAMERGSVEERQYIEGPGDLLPLL